MTAIGTFTRQNGIVAEVIGVTKRVHAVENGNVLSTTMFEVKISEEKEELNDLLINAIDETLKQIFKEEGTRVIYNHLENNSHLKREEIAEKTKVFSAGLEKLLGSAAPVIKKVILKNLYSKLEFDFSEKEGYEFSDYVRELEEKLNVEG